jgi:hypothetical protein
MELIFNVLLLLATNKGKYVLSLRGKFFEVLN